MPNLGIGIGISLGHGPGLLFPPSVYRRGARDVDPATFRRGHMIGRGPQRGIITTESLKIYFTHKPLVELEVSVSPAIATS